MTNTDTSPEAVERYDHYGSFNTIMQSPYGPYVKHDDYATLSAELEKVRADRDAARKEALEEAAEVVSGSCWAMPVYGNSYNAGVRDIADAIRAMIKEGKE